MDLIDSALNRIELQNQTQDNLLATKEALDSEIARAAEKENELLENINVETTRAENAETEILNQLDSEITRAMQAEDIISNSLEDHTTSSLAHNDIRLLISGLTTKLNSLADSDDTTLDQLSEIVAYIKNNKSLIDGITTSKVNVSDIIDNLTSTAVNKPLSAKQGKVLKDLINALTTAVGDKVDKVSGKGLSTNDYTTAEKNKLSGIASGAEVNVQPDWNTTDTTSDAYIKNKPTSLPANGGTAETISKTLPISKGGTGQTTAKEAANGLIESLVVGQDGLAPDDTAMYLTYNGTEWVRRNIGTLVSYIKNKLERAFSLKKIYTINLSQYANTNFYLVTFNNTRNEIDCEIHSQSANSSAAYNQNVLHFLLTRQGWSDTPKKFIILNHSVFSDSEITIASVVSGDHNGNNGVYLRGGLTYEIYSNTPVTLRTSQYTGGDEVFPSGTTTCYKTGFTNVSVLIDFTANGNTGDFSKFDGELRAGSFTGNLTGNVTGNAASASRLKDRGDVAAETGSDVPDVTGLSMSRAYNNGYPYSFGNILTAFGRGANQLFMGWSGTDGGNSNLYYRNKRDNADANWSSWKQIAFTDSNITGTAKYTNYVNANNIPANMNLNNYATPGFYYCPANATVATLSNTPTNNAFFMIVGKHAGTYQEVIEYMTASPKRYMRNYYNNTWGSWYRVYTTADAPPDTKYTAATATPKAAGNAAVGTSVKYAREDHIHPLQTSVSGSSGSCTGNAATATKATHDGDGNVIKDTYVSKKESRNVKLLEFIAKKINTSNYISDVSSTLNNAILCGNNNSINKTDTGAPAFNEAILGGQNNLIESGYSSVILGGSYNTIKSGSSNSAIIAGNNITCLSYQNVTGHYNDNSKATAGTEAGTGTGTAFCIGNGTLSAKSNAARIDYNGKMWCKQAYSATGADYAELFEWEDGNPDNEDRRGYFVTMDGEKIRKASAGDWILGIVSANPCILGNTDMEWQGQFMKDEFGDYIIEHGVETVTETAYETDDDGNVVLDNKGNPVTKEVERKVPYQFYKVNPDYNPEEEYTFRLDRPEWDAVGMMGVLAVRDDGTCKVNGFCTCAAGGIATESDCGYRVVKRVTDNIVKVVFK